MKIITTQCNNCNAIEHTLASINATCFYCNKGIMVLKQSMKTSPTDFDGGFYV